MPPTFTFLFRTDAGRIDRPTWWRGTIMLAGPLVLATLGWIALAPWAHRGLDERALVDVTYARRLCLSAALCLRDPARRGLVL